MKQINPLYIALLLVVALSAVLLNLNEAKSTELAAASALRETEMTAQRIVSLRKEWERGRESASNLDRLLQFAPLRGTEFAKEHTRSSVILTAKSIDKSAADYLLNKLLNNAYVIKTLEIRRISAQKAYLHVEVAQ